MAGVERVEILLEPVEQRVAIAPDLVPEVVHQPGEAVEGVEVAAEVGRQGAAGHAEVLQAGLAHHGLGVRDSERRCANTALRPFGRLRAKGGRGAGHAGTGP